jgi:glycosyltransferase involved in cell wall biosynthesis
MRSIQFFPWYELEGIECTVSPFFDDTQLAGRYSQKHYGYWSLVKAYSQRVLTLWQGQQFDLVWIEKEALPWLPFLFEGLLLHGKPYVVDCDDAIFHNYDRHPSALVRSLFGKRIDHLMAGSRLMVAGNEYLAQRARDSGAPWVEVAPTVIDLDRYSVKPDSVASTDPLRIVWIGSPSTTRYLELLREPLTELSRRFSIQLRVIGGEVFSIPGVDCAVIPWTEETEVAAILACDIGVMPLIDSPWERGKCGYKLIQYMACGLPVVASPVGVNCEIVRPGENGYLAGNTQEWVDSMSSLLCDAGLRKRMGTVGRKLVEDQYCIQQVATRMAGLLRTAWEGR